MITFHNFNIMWYCTFSDLKVHGSEAVSVLELPLKVTETGDILSGGASGGAGGRGAANGGGGGATDHMRGGGPGEAGESGGARHRGWREHLT